MVKILVNPEGYIDFEAPIQMTDEQRKRFIKFFKKMFPEVKIVSGVKEKVKKPPEIIDHHPKKWTVDECHLLFGPETNEELAEKMDRDKMSVMMKRGIFVSDFMIWAKNKGYKFPPTKKMIQEFEARGS